MELGYFTAVFTHLDHTIVDVFPSSFASLRLCVRFESVVHLPENRCNLNSSNFTTSESGLLVSK